ncbi:MAG: PKD domain-containing protein [Sulfurovum sp.]|nr:PKD domain-containing protein [Sulfurovum sp.]
MYLQNNATDNQVAEISIDILEVTEESIEVSIYGGDENGVKSVETYLIDAYRLSLFTQDGETVYVMDSDMQVFDESTDTSFDFEVRFDKVYQAKQYIIRSVAYTINGMSVTEEVVSSNYLLRTEGSVDTNIAPTAVTSQDRTVVIGQGIALSGSQSTDSDGSIVSYTWYDEKGLVLSTLITFRHVINTVGTYTIRLIVEDNEGKKGSDTVTIVVVNP